MSLMVVEGMVGGGNNCLNVTYKKNGRPCKAQIKGGSRRVDAKKTSAVI